jgi:hypothetical protein
MKTAGCIRIGRRDRGLPGSIANERDLTTFSPVHRRSGYLENASNLQGDFTIRSPPSPSCKGAMCATLARPPALFSCMRNQEGWVLLIPRVCICLQLCGSVQPEFRGQHAQVAINQMLSTQAALQGSKQEIIIGGVVVWRNTFTIGLNGSRCGICVPRRYAGSPDVWR